MTIELKFMDELPQKANNSRTVYKMWWCNKCSFYNGHGRTICFNCGKQKDAFISKEVK